jgi:hypothetical protein
MVAGLVNHHPIAPMVFNGSYKTEGFDAWGEDLVIKELKPVRSS